MIYRRRIIGDINEGIEIIPATESTNTVKRIDLVQGDSIKVHLADIENQTQIYYVEVPDYLRVKPPDWRYLAYDRDVVEKLISVCVADNCKAFFCFDPITESFLKGLQHTLSIALGDLSSVMNLVSVECNAREETPGKYAVVVEYEHKNGEARCLHMTYECCM